MPPDPDPSSEENMLECVSSNDCSVKSANPDLNLMRNDEILVESRDYALNKGKALSKKLMGCAKDHIKIEMKQNKNLVLELSTSAYELIKQSIREFLNTITNDVTFQLAYDEEKVVDENGDNVETRFKVTNRKVDGNPGKISKLTINCYHTTSRILVNGSKVDLFVTVGLPLVKKQIAQFYTDLNDLNKYFENTLQAFNVAKPAQTMDRNNLMPIENGTNRDSGMEQSVFLCPICEEVANQHTICCESCDSWYHYGCVGISVNDVIKISPEIPYICENCNEGLIYGECETGIENRPHEHRQDSMVDPETTEVNEIPQQDSNIIAEQIATESTQTVSAKKNDFTPQTESSLNTPANKNNKKKSESKVISGITKGKKNQNLEHEQVNIQQSQYIQRLELRIKELQNSVSVLKQRDELLAPNAPSNESNSNRSNTNSEQNMNHEQFRMNSLGCPSASQHRENCYIQAMDMRIKQLETAMLQNLYIMTMGGTQTNLQIQQQANLLNNLQLQQMYMINNLHQPRPMVPSGYVGNPYHVHPYAYPNVGIPGNGTGTPYSNPRMTFQQTPVFNSSIPPPNLWFPPNTQQQMYPVLGLGTSKVGQTTVQPVDPVSGQMANSRQSVDGNNPTNPSQNLSTQHSTNPTSTMLGGRNEALGRQNRATNTVIQGNRRKEKSTARKEVVDLTLENPVSGSQTHQPANTTDKHSTDAHSGTELEPNTVSGDPGSMIQADGKVVSDRRVPSLPKIEVGIPNKQFSGSIDMNGRDSHEPNKTGHQSFLCIPGLQKKPPEHILTESTLFQSIRL